jgi:16S rRNA (cytosine1402-N4)-methyltransferase
MAREVVRWLVTGEAGWICDATVGSGGHAEVILEAMRPDGRLVGLDQDPRALGRAGAHLARFGDRVILRAANFRRLAEVVLPIVPEGVDGVLMDLGVSSEQLDEPDAGFSYRSSGPLSMAMDPDRRPDAADLVNGLPPGELARILAEFGDVRQPGRVARAIVQGRPYRLTSELVRVLERSGAGRPEELSRVFQALRVAVNQELDALREALAALEQVVRPGGRVVVIAYHSGEDRMVKQFFAPVRYGKPLPWLPAEEKGPRWELLVKGALKADGAEVAVNSRSRSARLRAARRVV